MTDSSASSTPDAANARRLEHSISVSRDIAAPPAAVWAVLTDVEDSAEHLSGVEAVEMLTEGDYRVGTRWRETRTMMGRRETQEMEVTHVKANRATVIAADAGGMDTTTTFTLEPALHGSHTRIAMAFEGILSQPTRVQRVMMSLFGNLGLKATRRAMEQDLADIAAVAEQRPTLRH
ncbi:SRPBCC family protein [Kribbia dieselivorans]|uniref:SRPBCC family protein n=1 Tax=Kribbia dieselivorans TaxID=331526 RepID=UPI0008399473|nr:SRPBCC family protein [Kribbia dieselivorans]